jgi:hypothetical protein
MATFVAGLETTVMRRLEATVVRRTEATFLRRAEAALAGRTLVAALEVAAVGAFGETRTLAVAVARRCLAVEIATA